MKHTFYNNFFLVFHLDSNDKKNIMFVLSNNSQRFLYLIALLGVVMISSNLGKLINLPIKAF